MAPSMNASQIGWCSEVSDTQSGPPVLWNSLAPRVWCWARLK